MSWFIRKGRKRKMAMAEKQRNRPAGYSIPRSRERAFIKALNKNRKIQKEAPEIDFSMVKRLSEEDEKK